MTSSMIDSDMTKFILDLFLNKHVSQFQRLNESWFIACFQYHILHVSSKSILKSDNIIDKNLSNRAKLMLQNVERSTVTNF